MSDAALAAPKEALTSLRSLLRLVLFATAVLTALLLALPSRGQLPTATLNGIITDPKDLAVAGAKVTLVNQATGVRREAATGDTGQYVFAELPAGDYTLRIESSGFAPREYKDLHLVPAQLAEPRAKQSTRAREKCFRR